MYLNLIFSFFSAPSLSIILITEKIRRNLDILLVNKV